MTNEAGYNDEHHLIEIKEPGYAIQALRHYLSEPWNSDIFDYAIQGRDFEECLARIAEKLDILLDGDYDAENLCAVLAAALKNRKKPGTANQPWLRVPGLVSAEITERTNGTVTIDSGLELGTISAPQTKEPPTSPELTRERPDHSKKALN